VKELNSQRVILKLEKLIEDGKHLLTTIEPRCLFPERNKKGKAAGEEYADPFLHLKFITSSLYFVSTTIGEDNAFYKAIFSSQYGLVEESIKRQVALLEALHSELSDMWYWSAQGLASAEMFSNMLEEAQHLLDKGFTLPATVLGGCVIETHIKNLCKKNSIKTDIKKENGDTTPKKTSALNQELYSIGVYNLNNSKEVTNYLGLRNSAAHGKSNEIDKEQVALMLQGISAFVNRNPI